MALTERLRTETTDVSGEAPAEMAAGDDGSKRALLDAVKNLPVFKNPAAGGIAAGTAALAAAVLVRSIGAGELWALAVRAFNAKTPLGFAVRQGLGELATSPLGDFRRRLGPGSRPLKAWRAVEAGVLAYKYLARSRPGRLLPAPR
jgi:hypothetical protein